MDLSGLSEECKEKVLPLKNQEYFNYLFDELVRLENYSDVDLVSNSLDSMVADGNLTEQELESFRDLDGDFITNEVEFAENTDPFNVYTSGTILDDFNALYSYEVHPRDQEAVAKFLESIPNVKDRVRIWNIAMGPFWYVNSTMSDGGTPFTHEMGMELSARDPLIKYYAERTEIRWSEITVAHRNSSKTRVEVGRVFVEGEPLHIKYGANELDLSQVQNNANQASLYFIYGRISACGPSSLANTALFRAMGLDAYSVGGMVPADTPTGVSGHGWCEVLIDGELYVSEYNDLTPREGYYEQHGYSPNDLYNPDWNKKV